MYLTPEERARADAAAARAQELEAARDRDRAAARARRAAWWGRTSTALGRAVADNALVVALLGFGMYGSFGHVVTSATSHGQTRNMAVSIAITIDLLAVVALAEYRRRRRHLEPARYPAAVAVFGIAVQLAANVSTAQRNPGAVFYAAWPALAFLLAAGLVETRGSSKADPKPPKRPATDQKPSRPGRRPAGPGPGPAEVAAPAPRPQLPAAPVAALEPAPASRPVVERVPDTEAATPPGVVPAALVEAARDPEWRAQIKGAGGLMEKYGWTERQARRRVEAAQALAAEQRAAAAGS